MMDMHVEPKRFEVIVYNEGGCEVLDLCWQSADMTSLPGPDDLKVAQKVWRSITKSKAEKAGAYNHQGLAGVNVTLFAVFSDDEENDRYVFLADRFL